MIPRYRSPLSPADVVAAWIGRRAQVAVATSVPGFPKGAVPTWLPSASDGLHRLLVGEGSFGTIVVPAYTCLRVIDAVRAAGWIPAFVDVDPATLSMDASDAARVLQLRGGGPAVILATHLHGIPCPTTDLRRVAQEHGARMIEDCAMAQGAQTANGPVGIAGDAAVFSFGPGKPLPFGAGGAAIGTMPLAPVPRYASLHSPWGRWLSRAGWIGHARFGAQEAFKTALRREAAGGAEPSFRSASWTRSSLAALCGLATDPASEVALKQRRAASRRWLAAVARVGNPRVAVPIFRVGDVPCCAGVPMLVRDPSKLAIRLRQLGVYTARLFSYSAAARSGGGVFPGAESIAARVLLLPTDPLLDDIEADVLAAIADA